MEFFPFEKRAEWSNETSRMAVVRAESWDDAMRLLTRFGHQEGMKTIVGEGPRQQLDQWAKAIATAEPWLGSVRIDRVIVVASNWGLGPNDGDRWTKGDDATLIVLALEGERRRVLRWELAPGTETDQKLRAVPLHMKGTKRRPVGFDLAAEILEAFP